MKTSGGANRFFIGVDFSLQVNSYLFSRLAAVLSAVLALGAAPVCAQNEAKPAPPPGPDLQVEFLGAEKGYVEGTQSVSMLCVIRNVGTGSLPENSARVRCYPLTGLDFMSGQLWPLIPALPPNQAVAFRWRLAISDQTTPLVFSVLINKAEKAAGEIEAHTVAAPNGQKPADAVDVTVTPRVAAAIIPRFTGVAHLLGGAAGWGKTPQADADDANAWIGNDRVFLHVMAAQGRFPVAALAAKDGTEWKTVALATPLARVRSGEEGQIGWWDTFRWQKSSYRASKDGASLTLMGNVGANWSAELTLESRPDTGSISGRLRLFARRAMRCYGVELPRLLASAPANAPGTKADGSAQYVAFVASPLADIERLSASHTGALTFGISWPSNAPLAGWRSARMPTGDIEHLPVLGGEWKSEDRGTLVSSGASVEFPFKIFAFGPSDTVKDAQRFSQP